jgi:hypothetical protein
MQLMPQMKLRKQLRRAQQSDERKISERLRIFADIADINEILKEYLKTGVTFTGLFL